MRRKHRRLTTEADLDITPFMNLMIVLVPVLLINMVFAHTTVLELNFPRSSGAPATEQSIQPVVVISGDELQVTDNDGHVLREIPALDDGPDYDQLQQVMKQLKSRWPDQDDVTIRSAPDTRYQTLVRVMDSVRSFRTVEVTSVVEVTLFPNISVGDAPGSQISEVGQ